MTGSAPEGITLGRTRFTSELRVRPDDIDMNQHVHNSRYFDYVLAARYDQMERCYKMSMEEFVAAGYGWVVKTAHIDFKRPLVMGDVVSVTTWVDGLIKHGVRVRFEMVRQKTGKLASDGYFDYTMIDLKTGRGVPIPDWILAKYTI